MEPYQHCYMILTVYQTLAHTNSLWLNRLSIKVKIRTGQKQHPLCSGELYHIFSKLYPNLHIQFVKSTK